MTVKSDPIWVPSKADIVFEDADIIAINKPAGLPSQATLDPKRHHLMKAVELYLKQTSPHAYCGLHHRLDRDTSGVIVLTKSKRANKGLAEQISQHQIQKTYIAISQTFPTSPADSEWTVKNHLKKSHRFKGKMEAARSGGDLAETHFTKLADLNEARLVQALPRTGRMHQIRVHLAGCALPILGDNMYGTRASFRRAPRTMLHAWKLEIKHPITGEGLVLKAPLPKDMTDLIKDLGGTWAADGN